jgi:uncharacterized cupredoxin-like copper-binding protein
VSRDPRPPSLSRGRPARAAALALTLGLGVLAGCSGDGDSAAGPAATPATEEAQTLPTQTTEASPSPSPSAVATTAPAPAPVALRATEVEFAIELPSTELTAGSYTIEVVNDGDGTHDLVIEDAGGTDVAASEILGPGQSGTVEVVLQPGEYVFYCSIGNHRQMGMEVAVTVV